MWSEEQKNWDASLGNFRSYSLVNGGVVILSKWPIEEKIQYIFNDSGCGTDWFANKGFVYVKINKEGKNSMSSEPTLSLRIRTVQI